MAITAIYSTANEEGVDINAVYTLDPQGAPEYPGPPFLAGTVGYGTDGSEWVYCTASITIAAGSVVIISGVPASWSVALIGGATTATSPFGRLVGVVGGSKGSLVVPAPTGTQTGSYFWVQRAGNAPNIKSIATGTIQVQLYGVATVAGAVSAAAGGSGTTYQVNGLVLSQATGSVAGPNTGILNYPTVGTTG